MCGKRKGSCGVWWIILCFGCKFDKANIVRGSCWKQQMVCNNCSNAKHIDISIELEDKRKINPISPLETTNCTNALKVDWTEKLILSNANSNDFVIIACDNSLANRSHSNVCYYADILTNWNGIYQLGVVCYLKIQKFQKFSNGTTTTLEKRINQIHVYLERTNGEPIMFKITT